MKKPVQTKKQKKIRGDFMSRNRARQSGENTSPGKGNHNHVDDLLKCIGIAGLVGIAGVLLILLLLAGLLSFGSVPLGFIRPAGVVVGCMGAAIAGYVCSRLNQKNGFFLGLCCAGILFLILLLCAIGVTGQSPGFFSMIKLFSMMICGAIGGSIGVNRKNAKPRPQARR